MHIRTKSDTRLYIKCLEAYLRSEGIDPQEDKLYALAHDINVVFKYAVCYHEMLRCADIFNRHYGRSDSAWFEDAVDKTAFGIEHGMFVSYDPELELNPNFKEVDFFVGLYDSDVAHYDEWLNLPKVQDFLLQGINPFGRASAAARPKRPAAAAARIEAADESNDPDIDVELFRTKGPHLYETHNELSWRTAAFLYFEYTGENKERTIRLCRQLFDPSSKQSREEKIKSNVESVIANRYPIERSFRAFMQQVVGHKSEETKIAADLQQFEIAVPPENTYRLGVDEYVGDYIEEAVAKCRRGQSLVLVSGTGTGKTEGIMRLVTRQAEGLDFGQERLPVEGNGKRMLIIEPLKSIVKSKFRKYEHLIEFVYEERIHRQEKDICVAIIDKVRDCVHLGTFQEPAFDYIVVDESHLLTMSEYRRKCGLLLDYLRSQRINSKIIYMTGTPVFERSFLPKDTVCVRLTKAAQHPKRVNIFTQYVRPLTVMHRAIAEEIRCGRKVICVLRSKSHQAGIVQAAEEILRRKVRWDVFYSDAAETPLARSIVERKTLGDTELAFVTSVFSVGVDLEGEENAVMYTYQELNGVAVDQYANRLRRVPIEFNMYGRYLQKDYRPLKSFERDMSKVDDDNLLARLNSGAEQARAARRILEHADMPYIVYDEEIGCYAINSTLYDMHRYYRAWEGWSAQWQVCAEYLRKMGYEVNIDPKREAQAAADPKSSKQINQEKTQRRNERYDRFMKIWNEYRNDLQKLYEDIVRTDYTVQQGLEPLLLGKVQKAKGEDEQIGYARTVYTYDTQALSALLNFMRIAAYCQFSCEECFAAAAKSLIDRPHKQISVGKMEAQIVRLKLLCAQDKYLFKVLEKIESLNNTDGRKILSAQEYDAFVDALVAYYWEYATYKELKDMEAMRSIFGGYLHAYYRIAQPVTLGGDYCIYKRYDRSTEELAYHNLYKKRLPSLSKVKLPKRFFYKSKKSKKESKEDDSYMLDLISYLEPLRKRTT